MPCNIGSISDVSKYPSAFNFRKRQQLKMEVMCSGNEVDEFLTNWTGIWSSCRLYHIGDSIFFETSVTSSVTTQNTATYDGAVRFILRPTASRCRSLYWSLLDSWFPSSFGRPALREYRSKFYWHNSLSLSGPSPAELMTPFCVSYKALPTWRARFPYLHSPGIGWLSYTPEHCVPFL
jgi:hypothetical protein